jgi:hypothetical protein
MALVNYSDLLTSVANWTKRSDLTTIIPDFIELAESKFSRRLICRDQETTIATTAISATFTVALPTGCAQVKDLWIAETFKLLQARPLNVVKPRQYGAASEATMYTFTGGGFVFDGTGNIAGTYYAEIPALTVSNTTNWLMTKWPDLYLSGVLAEAAFYVKDEARAALWTARTDALINEINGNDQDSAHGGPMTVRVS